MCIDLKVEKHLERIANAMEVANRMKAIELYYDGCHDKHEQQELIEKKIFPSVGLSIKK